MSAQVRPGYKLTEVGVIPDDWEVTALGRIASIEGGYAFSSKKFLQRGVYQIVKMSNLYEGYLDLERSASFLNDLNESERRYLLNQNDILITLTGTTGKRDFGFTKIINKEKGLLLNQRVARLVVGQRAVPQYVAFQLKFDIFLDQFFDVSKGGTGNQTNVGTSDVESMFVPVPPICEQRAIATALSDMDALINCLDQLIAKKRDIKQAAMQQLLTGQQRLPGFSGEWEVKRLGDFGRCLRGVSYKGDADLLPYDTDETYRLLRSNNVQQSIIDTDGLQFVSSRCVSNHQILKPKDILICMANGSKDLVGKAGLFEVLDGHQYTFGAFMGCFRMSTNAVPNFIFALFGTHKYKSYIANLLAGSSINNLRPSDVEQMEFGFPQKNEQTAIATTLSDMDSELATLETRRDKARHLKQGMMQELLTGRIRLSQSSQEAKLC